MSVPISLIQRARKLVRVPVLTDHKGSSGRITVIGGSVDYTGAPFFSATAALRAGVDLATVVCPPSAGAAIKAMSAGDLIVRPMLAEDEDTSATSTCVTSGAPAFRSARDDQPHASFYSSKDPLLEQALSRSHALVIGPGLAFPHCPPHTLQRLQAVLAHPARPPTVIDASGIPLLAPHLIAHRPHLAAPTALTLTPNANEIKILFRALAQHCSASAQVATQHCEADGSTASHPLAQDVATAAGNGHAQSMALAVSRHLQCAVLLKGSEDYCAVNGNPIGVVAVPCPSPRRCGGQGDILTGLLAAFLTWHALLEGSRAPTTSTSTTPDADQTEAVAAAIVGACLVMKWTAVETAARLGHHRYLASDMLADISVTVDRFAAGNDGSRPYE